MTERGDDTPLERVVGRVRAAAAGPTLVCVGGLHGNEPAGIEALQRVAARLETSGIVRGDWLAVAGNLAALTQRIRFVDRDLNRDWSATAFDGAGVPTHAGPEDREQREVAAILQEVFDRARGPVFVLDLHTTSGPGLPFTVIADSMPSRRFAMTFPNPLVLGLEEHLRGTLIDIVTGLGHAGVAFEGGQNDDPMSRDHLEAAIWHALGAAGLTDGDALRGAREHLRAAADGLPSVVEIRYRHALRNGEGFVMQPGRRGFDIVRAGEPLASDDDGEIRAPETGYLLMPLYQPWGDDGFFVARRVRRFWLTVSAALRALRAYRIVHWLPGVRRDPDDPNVLVVDRHTARWLALEFLHLLGFKRVGEDGDVLRMARR